MTYYPARIPDPALALSYHFTELTRILPQVPIAPGLGAAACRMMDRGTLPPEGLAVWPSALGEADLALMAAGAFDEHHIRDLPLPSGDQLQRAAGFVASSLLTTIHQLSLGEEGRSLPDIPRPVERDPAVAAATDYLRDPEGRAAARDLFSAAEAALNTPLARVMARAYRSQIVQVAHEFGPIDAERDPTAYGEKQAVLSARRADIAYKLGVIIRPELDARGVGHHHELTSEQLDVATHNLTRWQPALAWFAPAA